LEISEHLLPFRQCPALVEEIQNCSVAILFQRSDLTEDQARRYRQMERISLSKTPAGILVHQSPLRARLYLFSPEPWILEVIIGEKRGTGQE